MSEAKILPFGSTNDVTSSIDAKDAITTRMAQTMERYEKDTGQPAVAAVWVIMGDDGSHRIGWDTTKSDLNAKSHLGLALAAIVSNLS